MYTTTAFTSARAFFGAAVAAGALLAGSALAKDPVTVSYHVTTRGLDDNQPAGAYELYRRVKHAADVVCTHGLRVDLAPAPDPQGCYEKALADAIRAAHLPLLTQAFLETHSVQEAAALGIKPVQLAAK